MQSQRGGGFRVRPPKPLAIFGAMFGLGILTFGIVFMGRAKHPNWAFLLFWLAAGVCFIGFNLWAAFAKSGRMYDIDPPSHDDTDQHSA